MPLADDLRELSCGRRWYKYNKWDCVPFVEPQDGYDSRINPVKINLTVNLQLTKNFNFVWESDKNQPVIYSLAASWTIHENEKLERQTSLTKYINISHKRWSRRKKLWQGSICMYVSMQVNAINIFYSTFKPTFPNPLIPPAQIRLLTTQAPKQVQKLAR